MTLNYLLLYLIQQTGLFLAVALGIAMQYLCINTHKSMGVLTEDCFSIMFILTFILSLQLLQLTLFLIQTFCKLEKFIIQYFINVDPWNKLIFLNSYKFQSYMVSAYFELNQTMKSLTMRELVLQSQSLQPKCILWLAQNFDVITVGLETYILVF